MGAKNPRSLARVVRQLLISDEIRTTEFMCGVERSPKKGRLGVRQQCVCQVYADLANTDQDLTDGLRDRLNAMAARNATLSSNTAHRPIFFQSVTGGAGVSTALGAVTSVPSSTWA